MAVVTALLVAALVVLLVLLSFSTLREVASIMRGSPDRNRRE